MREETICVRMPDRITGLRCGFGAEHPFHCECKTS